MVEFLYTRDYDAALRPSEAADLMQSSEPASSSLHRIMSPAAGGSDVVLQHVRVSVIADYYDIKGLAKLANSKIQSKHSEKGDTQALADAIKESSDLTSDTDLHETIAALAAQNLSNLLDTTVFHDLIGDFGLKIMRKYVQKTESIEEELRDMTNRLSVSVASEEAARDTAQRSAARTARTHESITQCLQTLRERDRCRNYKCSALFTCYIEERGHQPVYTLRCAKCGCRH